MRLVESHDRISDTWPERRPQARLGRFLDRRQPRHPQFARLCPQGRHRAHYLKTKKPRSKILILDAKDNFSQQRLFARAWKELYGDMIERIALSQGGRAT
ncbi:hypothetical protein SAMN05216525_103393 [Bradyrhizobium sp. Gha]|nr:hypothetical protein SAMN05216525_103393 [Bradyrhizobium sp. Gha]